MAAHALYHGFVVGMPEASGLPYACGGHHVRVHRGHRAAVAAEEQDAIPDD